MKFGLLLTFPNIWSWPHSIDLSDPRYVLCLEVGPRDAADLKFTCTELLLSDGGGSSIRNGNSGVVVVVLVTVVVVVVVVVVIVVW